jgi:hypothetical protein
MPEIQNINLSKIITQLELIDRNGNQVIKCIYDDLEYFFDELTCFKRNDKSDLLINTEMK